MILLTAYIDAAILNTLSQKTKAGSRNPFSTGEKSPQPLAAFLCASFSAALCRAYSVMAGLFGQRSALAAPVGGFRPHLSPPPDSVETIAGGYIQPTGVAA